MIDPGVCSGAGLQRPLDTDLCVIALRNLHVDQFEPCVDARLERICPQGLQLQLQLGDGHRPGFLAQMPRRRLAKLVHALLDALLNRIGRSGTRRRLPRGCLRESAERR
ncbi:hypothetical protein [Panacagrimonas sp.]|uniref:hypothetical protein n=1 Tax=Panacagrimonas sp. TaxID=2480088 RepID=UPI003B52A128